MINMNDVPAHTCKNCYFGIIDPFISRKYCYAIPRSEVCKVHDDSFCHLWKPNAATERIEYELIAQKLLIEKPDIGITIDGETVQIPENVLALIDKYYEKFRDLDKIVRAVKLDRYFNA